MSSRPLPAPTAPARHPARGRGLALPVVLVLLLVMAFAGLLAARRSATVEEISNNARVHQVAWLSAESGLRYCEAVVIDSVEGGGRFEDVIKQRVGTTTIADASDRNAAWSRIANWADTSAVLITAPVAGQNASAALQGAPAPRCLAEPLADGRYLVTARGLSAGASFNGSGQLLGGAEVWLQSVISPEPVHFNGKGYE